ncbi:class I SAM-dependent methyltransferase [Hasllibacter sp. MH4015]|uniref:class I SAM-dependent methyltransferase n=1 Tax=Hasllibacter sp. MH4015 TaxID=2854029 RepID=UPI001CD792A6|nr:class I SAM-dependent methyltransferase [Hasllibacter sp. MH4015]
MTQACRHCATPLTIDFVDLGFAPPSNAYLSEDALSAPELTFPLRVKTCPACFLVQTEDFAAADALFSPDYAYFSSTSKGWVAHAADYVEMITARLGLNADSHVIEVASNDGYLLKNFVAAGIPCLGVEPTKSTADTAKCLGIPVLQEFFGEEMARDLPKSDLVLGNNVYAHVPDINDFTRGLREVLKPEGVITLEFPHLMRLVEHNQFDTIYHEHFSYLSLLAVDRIMDAAGCRLFDVEELPTHGGSLRIYACRAEARHTETDALRAVRAEELARGMGSPAFYTEFQARAERVKDDVLRFLLDAKAEGKSVAAYGAAAKGNTLMNFAGIGKDLITFVCDAAEAKQGQFMPGSHLPILPPDVLTDRRPDYLVIFPWNIRDEVMAQNAHLAAKGTRFVTAVPALKIHG